MNAVQKAENERLGRIDWIQTRSGKQFSPLSPRAEDVDITDIAHALSMKCRFTGHTDRFYSVAEHCVRASYVAARPYKLVALLHDSAEAYLPDLAAPIKRKFLTEGLVPFVTTEALVEEAIFSALGLDPFLDALMSEEVKRADCIMLATEARDLMNADREVWGLTEVPFEFGGTVLGALGWSQKEAKAQFLTAYGSLR